MMALSPSELTDQRRRRRRRRLQHNSSERDKEARVFVSLFVCAHVRWKQKFAEGRERGSICAIASIGGNLRIWASSRVNSLVVAKTNTHTNLCGLGEAGAVLEGESSRQPKTKSNSCRARLVPLSSPPSPLSLSAGRPAVNSPKCFGQTDGRPKSWPAEA